MLKRIGTGLVIYFSHSYQFIPKGKRLSLRNEKNLKYWFLRFEYLATKSRIYITELKPYITTSNYGDPIWNKFQFKSMIAGYYRLPCTLEKIGCIKLFNEQNSKISSGTNNASQNHRTKEKEKGRFPSKSHFTLCLLFDSSTIYLFSHFPPTMAPF